MLKHYQVIGRPLPTAEVANPPAVRVQVFAPDAVIAKSIFWNTARRIARIKKSHGEILAVREVIEPEPTRAKTYGIWLTYKSLRATHNIYKEFRDTTTEGAVMRMYQEMGGTHNVKANEIIIVKVTEIQPDDVRHRSIEQFVEPGVKFPILKQSIRPANLAHKKIFSRHRPVVCGI